MKNLTAVLVVLMVAGLAGCPSAPTPTPSGELRAWSVWTENGREFSREVFNLEEVSVVAGDNAANFDFAGGSFASGDISYKLAGVNEMTHIAVYPDGDEAKLSIIGAHPYGFWYGGAWYPDGYWCCRDCSDVWYHGLCPYHGCNHGVVFYGDYTSDLWLTLIASAIDTFPTVQPPCTENGEFSITVPMGPTVETAVLTVKTAEKKPFVIVVRGQGENPQPSRFSLSTSVQGSGTITPVSGSYAAGTSVPIAASPASGWRFDHWLVNGVAGSGNAAAEVVMNSDISVVAVFLQNSTPPPVSVAGVEFVVTGSTATMRINPGTANLRAITANDSAQYLPANATFADIDQIGVEIVRIPAPYWYIREAGSATVTANAWSTTITLDGVGTDSAGVAKTLPLAYWTGGYAVPFYTIAGVPGRIFSLDTGVNAGARNSTALAVDVIGYIW